MTFNKTLIAIAITTIAAPLSAAEVYKTETQEFNVGGRVEVRGNVTDGDYSDKSRVRLNVDGSNEINEDFTAFGRYEFEITENGEDNTAKLNTRHMYVGGETQFGTLIYGHQNNAVTYITDFTDVAEIFSGYINENTQTTADRSNNTLRYIFEADALTLEASATQNANNNADGFGLMAAYKITPALELALGMASSDQEYGNGAQTEKSDTYMLGAKYTRGAMYFAATALAGNISAYNTADSDFVAADAIAVYNFGADDANMVNIGYSYYSADDIDKLDTNFVAVEYARYIDNFALYASYKIALSGDYSAGYKSNDNPTGTYEENELQFGARYAF